MSSIIWNIFIFLFRSDQLNTANTAVTVDTVEKPLSRYICVKGLALTSIVVVVVSHCIHKFHFSLNFSVYTSIIQWFFEKVKHYFKFFFLMKSMTYKLAEWDKCLILIQFFNEQSSTYSLTLKSTLVCVSEYSYLYNCIC